MIKKTNRVIGWIMMLLILLGYSINVSAHDNVKQQLPTTAKITIIDKTTGQ